VAVADRGVSVSEHEWGTAPEFVGPRHELRERLLLDLVLSAKPGPEVLDAGAGQGSLSAKLSELGFDVTSADASPAAVSVLEKRLGGTVVRADVTALPFEGESFDAVVLGEVLEHVEDDRGALDEVARVLRPGGLLALSVPANPKLFGPSDVWAGHIRRYTRAELIDACTTAGFRVERCVGWGFPVSRLYHRHVYERYLDRRGTARPTRRQKPLVSLLGAVLQIDRLFVGVERGALGYLALATRH
jgi:2-polyprenyl-3-methyl-5-hydroxy-6-metoxy-1,4-benzoquinol methylase